MYRSMFRSRCGAERHGSPFEDLEARRLLSAGFRTVDGSGNNLVHPEWGSAGIQLLREVPSEYADGVSMPGGVGRPSARAVSNAVAASLPDGQLNDRDLSAFVYAWGQFLDHDLDLTGGGSPAEPFDVLVPQGDPYFDPAATGTQVIRLNRSTYDPDTGTSNPRQQTNALTAWVDGSVVYGSDPQRAAALRTFSGGKLKTGDGGLLPLNTAGLPNANDAHRVLDDRLFLAGDVRANENIELTSIQTLFVREHNRIARSLAADNPWLRDEQLYQRAREVVGAEIQAITYNEFLPALLGDGALAPYTGYKPWVNPGIANEFSTAAFRVGHTMLEDDVEFLDDDGEEVRDELALRDAFFNPDVVRETGIDPILKYLASDRMQEVDTRVVDGVRNFLFGPPGAGGFDLASLNIQRGRDHGLADYNATRVAFGLPRVESFSQITSDATLASTLGGLYGSVDNVDLWVGGLAEDHVAGTSIGPLFRAILADQFQRLRDGDRFWYEANFTDRQVAVLNRTDLSDVIRRNTALDNLQRDVFVFDVTVTGNVFEDRNGNGSQDWFERPLPKWTVQLLDGDGGVVDTAVTTATGRFKFTGLDLGVFQVRTAAPAGWVQTTKDPDDIAVTRGMRVSGLTFGFQRSTTTAALAPATALSDATASPDAAGSIASTDLSADVSPDLQQLLDETDELLRTLAA